MLRKLGFLVAALSLVLPVSAADRPGSISGHVRSANGIPQMGAVVEVLGTAMQGLKVFTDEKGFFSASGLTPGVYDLKVSAPSFLPTVREQIGLRAGGTAIVNVTLSTLFEAMQMGPVRTVKDDDDWKWVLRSVTNRPILRVLDDGSTVVASSGEKDEHDLKGTLSFLAGSQSDGFGSSSDMSTGFSVEKSLFASSGTLAFQGNVGYSGGLPDAVLHASYKHKLPTSEPQIGFTMRRLKSADAGLHTALQALSLTSADNVTIGNLELGFGGELQTIQFLGRVTAFRPFGSADLHLTPNTLIEYRYATSQPNTRLEKGFDTAPADLSESGPRVSMTSFTPAIERAHHHEISVSQRVGKTSMQLAVYADRVLNPALTGVGEFSGFNGDVLPDLYSGTFTYQGSELDARGLRAVLERKLAADLTATLDYAYGGALDLSESDVTLQQARSLMKVADRHSVAAKFSGTVPKTKTRWISSYRWTSGRTLTPVDWFNASPGQSDPYWNLFIRQPIPGMSFLPGHMDALIDVRNLLAQGYVPVIGQDGHTIYLVQSARAIRGGVAFTF